VSCTCLRQTGGVSDVGVDPVATPDNVDKEPNLSDNIAFNPFVALAGTANTEEGEVDDWDLDYSASNPFAAALDQNDVEPSIHQQDALEGIILSGRCLTPVSIDNSHSFNK